MRNTWLWCLLLLLVAVMDGWAAEQIAAPRAADAPTSEQIADWICQLGSDDAATRDAAVRQILIAGKPATDALKAAVPNRLGEQFHASAKRVLDIFENGSGPVNDLQLRISTSRDTLKPGEKACILVELTNTGKEPMLVFIGSGVNFFEKGTAFRHLTIDPAKPWNTVLKPEFLGGAPPARMGPIIRRIKAGETLRRETELIYCTPAFLSTLPFAHPDYHPLQSIPASKLDPARDNFALGTLLPLRALLSAPHAARHRFSVSLEVREEWGLYRSSSYDWGREAQETAALKATRKWIGLAESNVIEVKVERE